MTDAMHLAVRKRVLHTAQSIKEASASTDTELVVGEMRRAWCVVRLQSAERIRCAWHRAAAYDAMSCYCWYYGNLARYRGISNTVIPVQCYSVLRAGMGEVRFKRKLGSV